MSTVSIMTKVTRDPRWFEEVTTRTATWTPPEYPNVFDMERYLLIDGDWIRWEAVPAGRGEMILNDAPPHTGETFMLHALETSVNTEWPVDGGGFISPTFSPPTNNSVWAWSTAKGRFILRRLRWGCIWGGGLSARKEDDTQRR